MVCQLFNSKLMIFRQKNFKTFWTTKNLERISMKKNNFSCPECGCEQKIYIKNKVYCHRCYLNLTRRIKNGNTKKSKRRIRQAI